MEVKSNWWVCHLLLTLAIPALILYVLLYGLLEIVFGPIQIQEPLVYVGYGMMLAYFALVITALYAYDVESRRLHEAGSDWVPKPWVWAVLHIVLTPIIASPLYLARRYQKVGLPWRDLVPRRFAS